MSSDQALELYAKQMALLFEQKETEDNWNKFEDCLIRFTALTKTSSNSPIFIGLVRSKLKNAIVQSLITERTRLARTALNLVSTLATSLGEKFESLSDIILPTVLKLTTRANKVYVSSATATLKTCIEAAGLPSLIPLLVDSLKTPSKSLRLASMDCVVLIAGRNSSDRILPWIGLIEKIVADGVVDPTPEVRDLARRLFDYYKSYYPNAVPRFQSTLSDMAKKYLKVSITVAPAPTISRRTSKVGLPPPKDNSRRKSYAPSSKNDPKLVSSVAPPQLSEIEEPIPSTELAPSSKKSIAHDASLNDTPRAPVTGAQRVARQPANPPKPRLKAAQRVPSSTSAAVIDETQQSLQTEPAAPAAEEKTLKAEPIFAPPAQVPQIMKTTKSKMAALKAAPPKPDAAQVHLEKAMSLTRLSSDIQSSDWAIRQVVFESLERFFLKSSDRDFSSPHSDKSLKLMMDGLGDAHFRVVLASLGAVLAFIDAPNFPLSKMEMLLPKICLVSFNPLQKSKHGIVEKGKLVIDRILSRVPPQVLGQAIANSLGNPLLASGKTRISVLGFINSLSISSLTLCFAKQSVCKALASRLVPFVLDQDPHILTMLKSIVLNLWHIYPDYLSQGFSNMSFAEKAQMTELTGKVFNLSKPGTPVADEVLEKAEVEGIANENDVENVVEAVEMNSATIIAPAEQNSVVVKDKAESSPKGSPKSPSKVPVLRSRAATPSNAIFNHTDSLETVIIGESTPKPSSKTPAKSNAKTPKPKEFAPLTPSLQKKKNSSNAPVIKSVPDLPVETVNDVVEATADIAEEILNCEPEKPAHEKAPLVRRASLENVKIQSTPVKSFLPKKAKTSFVSNVSDFRSPARVLSSVTPSAKVMESQSTPKSSLIKSAPRISPAKFMTKLKAATPEDERPAKSIDESDSRVIESPIPERIASTPEKIVEVNTSPSSVAHSDPESEATVAADLPKDRVLLSVGPSPVPPTSHSRIPSANLKPDTKAVSSTSTQDEGSKITLAVGEAVKMLQADKNQPIRTSLMQLYESIKSTKIPIEQATVASVLAALFKLDDEYTTDQKSMISYYLVLSKTELENNVDPLCMIQSISSVLKDGVGLKSGFVMAGNILKKWDEHGETKDSWEDELVSTLIKALSYSQSATRKSACDLASILISHRSDEWKEEFYSTVRSSAGSAKEKLLRKLIN